MGSQKTQLLRLGVLGTTLSNCVGGGFLGIHFGPGESRTGRHRAHPWPVWLYSQPRGSRLVCAMRGSAAAAAAAAGYGNRYVHHRFDQHPKSLLPNSHDIQASTRCALHTPRSISRSRVGYFVSWITRRRPHICWLCGPQQCRGEAYHQPIIGIVASLAARSKISSHGRTPHSSWLAPIRA